MMGVSHVKSVGIHVTKLLGLLILSAEYQMPCDDDSICGFRFSSGHVTLTKFCLQVYNIAGFCLT